MDGVGVGVCRCLNLLLRTEEGLARGSALLLGSESVDSEGGSARMSVEGSAGKAVG